MGDPIENLRRVVRAEVAELGSEAMKPSNGSLIRKACKADADALRAELAHIDAQEERIATLEAELERVRGECNARLSGGSRSEIAYINEVDSLRTRLAEREREALELLRVLTYLFPGSMWADQLAALEGGEGKNDG